MPTNLRGRSLLTLADYSSDEIVHLVTLASELKSLKRAGVFPKNLVNKNIALIFIKPSCRTRTAFVVAASDEGAHAEIFGPEDIRFGIKESVPDIARVFGRMFDGIMFRGFAHETVSTMARYAGVPVWNGLCDEYHPTQVLADLLTLQERFGDLRGLPFTYVGDARNNQATSLIIASKKLGLDFRLLAPKELHPSEQTMARVGALDGCRPGGRILITDDSARALEGSAAIYGDVWVSMGEEKLWKERVALLRNYKISEAMFEKTGRPDTVFLHCLPALHDGSTEFEKECPGIQEVEDSVFEGPHSLVFDQAENRMHTAKAVMVATVAG